jgi:hypothetical protein
MKYVLPVLRHNVPQSKYFLPVVLALIGCVPAAEKMSVTTHSGQGPVMTKLATNSFEIALPGTWRIETLKNPATVVGPDGEYLIINSVVISGGGSAKDYQAVRDELQHNAEDAMRLGAADQQLRITSPLEKELTPNGLFAEMHCTTADGQKFLSQFSIAGPSTLVFATVEGPSRASGGIEVVRNAMRNITWSQSFKDQKASQQTAP